MEVVFTFLAFQAIFVIFSALWSSKGNSKGVFADDHNLEYIELRNMHDEEEECIVAVASHDHYDKEFRACVYSVEKDKSKWLHAKTKEELEDMVDETYREFHAD